MQAPAFQMLDLAGKNTLERGAETHKDAGISIQIVAPAITVQFGQAKRKCPGKLKTLSGEAERVSEWLRIKRSGANYVTRLKSLGTLEQIELHGFTFVKGAIPVLLYGGEMDEHIFASGALNETVSFSPVEPLHCTLLSHKKLLSPFREEFILPAPVEAPMFRSTPSSTGRTRSRSRVRASPLQRPRLRLRRR